VAICGGQAIGTIRWECLDRMLIFTQRQLEVVLVSLQRPPTAPIPRPAVTALGIPGVSVDLAPDATQLRRSDRLGGLIHEHQLAA
jgi:hypothetical protein